MKHWDYWKNKNGTWDLAYSYDYLAYTNVKSFTDFDAVVREYLERNAEEQQKEKEMQKNG